MADEKRAHEGDEVALAASLFWTEDPSGDGGWMIELADAHDTIRLLFPYPFAVIADFAQRAGDSLADTARRFDGVVIEPPPRHAPLQLVRRQG